MDDASTDGSQEIIARYAGRVVPVLQAANGGQVTWYPGKGEPARIIETPTKTQAEVLQAFGYRIGDGGVLQEA